MDGWVPRDIGSLLCRWFVLPPDVDLANGQLELLTIDITVAVGILLGGALKLAMKAIVMPLLGADPINPAYHHLVGNDGALPGTLLQVTVGSGFGEKTVFRGFLFERLGRLLGHGTGATIAIVLLTSALFGVIHLPEHGLAGAEQAAIGGPVFGTIFALTSRLWLLILAHAAFNGVAVLVIYWNLESAIGHLISK